MRFLARLRNEAIPLSLLLLVGLVVFCGAYDKWSIRSWNVPLEYHEDAPQVLTWIKAASEGDYYPLVPVQVSRLGAPGEANWNDYPMYEKCLTVGMGIAARFVGLIPAANLGSLFAHLSAALTFYLCCRYLRIRTDLSFTVALLYGFAFFIFWRDLRHLLLAFIFTVPLAIVVSWIVGKASRLHWKTTRVWGCLAVAFVLGQGSPFNLAMFLQFVLIAGFFAWKVKGRIQNLKIALACVAVGGGGFIATNGGTFLYQAEHGPNALALEREYLHAEIFALKPMELIVPPPEHRLAPMAAIGKKYDEEQKIVGENFSPYLGVVGIGALVWLLAEAYAWLIGRSRKRPAWTILIQMHWVLFFCMLGGLNSLIAFGGFRLFRASNRFSVFIFALALLFLALRLGPLMQNWNRGKRYCMLGCILLVGLLDQVPHPLTGEALVSVEERLSSDIEFGMKLESELEPGAMVFQMPVVGFPEGLDVFSMEKYDHSRPYLHTESIRFSYGANKGRTHDSWQMIAEWLPAGSLVNYLQRMGFEAIIVNKKGYADGGSSIISALQSAGVEEIARDRRDEMVCFNLKPETEMISPASVFFFRKEAGWALVEYQGDDAVHWMEAMGIIALRNDEKTSKTLILHCDLISPVGQSGSVILNNQQLSQFAVTKDERKRIQLALLLPPGQSTLVFQANGGTFPHQRVTDLRVGLAVVNLLLEDSLR